MKVNVATKKKIQISARREKLLQSSEHLKSGNALLQFKDLSDSIEKLKNELNGNDFLKIKIYKNGFVLKADPKKSEALIRTFSKKTKLTKTTENKSYNNAVMAMYIAEHEDTTKTRATINRGISKQEKEFYETLSNSLNK